MTFHEGASRTPRLAAMPIEWDDVVAELTAWEKVYDKVVALRGKDRDALMREADFIENLAYAEDVGHWPSKPGTEFHRWLAVQGGTLARHENKLNLELRRAVRDAAFNFFSPPGDPDEFRVYDPKYIPALVDAVQAYMDEINKVTRLVGPGVFTYNGFTVQNPDRLVEESLRPALDAIDWLVALFKKRRIEPLIRETLNTIMISTDISSAGLYVSNYKRVVLNANAGTGSGKMLKNYIQEVLLHEIGHHVHMTYLVPAAREVWDSGWEHVDAARDKINDLIFVTSRDRHRFFELIERSGWNPVKAGRKVKGIDRLKFLAWLHKTQGNPLTSTPTQVRLNSYGRAVFHFFANPDEYRAEFADVGNNPRQVERMMERRERAHKSTLGLTPWYDGKHYPMLDGETVSEIRESDNAVDAALDALGIPTQYGRTNVKEDFAETFVLFVTNPRALSKTAHLRMARALWLSGFAGKPVMRMARRVAAVTAMHPDHWTLDEWVTEYSAVRVAARVLDAETVSAEDTPGIMPRLISQQVSRNLLRAFGPKGQQFFDIYYQLYTIYKGLPVPAEGLRRPFQAASRFIAPRLVTEETKNLFGDRIATLRRLLQRIEDGKAMVNTWRQIATMYAELMQEVAQDRGVFMKSRPTSGPVKWQFFRKMSDREARLQRLKRDDPVLYESIIEARSKLRQLNKEIEREILAADMIPSVRSRFGRPLMVGTDSKTGDEYVFDTDGDFLTIPEYDAKVRAADETRRRLTRTFPRDLESLRTFTDEEIEVYNELLRLTEEEPAATDEEIEKNAKGQVEYVAMTDDKAKASNITRIYPVQEIDDVRVVVGGRFKGIAVDDLINAAGRMIEGVAYDFDQRNGRPIPIETKGENGLPNLRVTREPYVTVESSKERRLYLRIPNSRDFTDMRGRIFDLAKVLPSMEMVKGSRRQGWLFHPKDFGVVREALGGMAMSKAAAERLEEHFLDLAQYELAIKRENLKHFSLARIGGFKDFDAKGRPLELWNKQREALASLSARGDTGVCALDTGVGKTKVALAAIQKMVRDGLADDPDTNGRFLYVCPAALKGGLPKSAHRNLVESGAFLDRVDVMSSRSFAIAYNRDRSFAEQYVAILVDEAHLMVKPSGGRFNPMARRLLLVNHPRKILMTASPMENDPMQLFLLSAISNNLVANYADEKEAMKKFRRQARAFKKRFAEEIGGRVVGIKRDDPVAARDFRVWVKRNIYFADKRDVEEVALPQLRPETEPLTMDPDVESAYREATSSVEKVLRAMALKYETRDPSQRDPDRGGLKTTDKRLEAARTKLKALFHRLNELSLMPDLIMDEDGNPRFPNAGNPKIERSVEIIDQRVSSKRRTLLFTDSPKMAVHTAKSLSKRFPGLLHAVALPDIIEVYKNGEIAEYVDEKGKTKPMRFRARKYRDSQGVVRKKDEWKAIVLSQKLGGNPRVVSMTLTKSYAVGQNLQMFDTVIHLDRDSWNSEAMKQRTARAWRSGNTWNSVDEVTLDMVFDNPRDKLDQTLDEIRRHLQALESDLFDSVVIDSQSEALGKEWFEMKQIDASFKELNRRMLELTLSPYLARMGEEGE